MQDALSKYIHQAEKGRHWAPSLGIGFDPNAIPDGPGTGSPENMAVSYILHNVRNSGRLATEHYAVKSATDYLEEHCDVPHQQAVRAARDAYETVRLELGPGLSRS